MTALSRRQFAGLATATAATAVVPGAAALGGPIDGSASAIATGPNAVKLQKALNSMVNKPLVGAVCSVSGRYGRLDLAAGRFSLAYPGATRNNARARISSMTKPMVAVAVFQLIEKGTWSLRTTIDDVLPGLWPGRGKVTVAQLMNHTSGMPDHVNDLFASVPRMTPQIMEDLTDGQWTHAQIIAKARRLRWKFTPGDGWAYSNTGYVVLSMMLEKATGLPIGELLKQRVFRRAGMNQTRLHNSAWVPSPRMEDYVIDGRRKERLQKVNMSIWSGAAGATATAADVTDFWAVLMRGGLVSQRSVNRMITPVGAAQDSDYGYGIQVSDDIYSGKGKLYGHSGGGFGSTALSLTSRDGWRRMAYMMTGRPLGGIEEVDLLNGQYDVTHAAFAVTLRRSGSVASVGEAASRPVLPMLQQSLRRYG